MQQIWRRAHVLPVLRGCSIHTPLVRRRFELLFHPYLRPVDGPVGQKCVDSDLYRQLLEVCLLINQLIKQCL